MYQLYVRSWLDTNGDGCGDLSGVTAGLDYLAWLGVDGIWLSSTMPSPDYDWGYDVCGYFGGHPDLGTLGDLDELIAEAGRRGIKVLMDLVPNHTGWSGPGLLHGRSAGRRDTRPLVRRHHQASKLKNLTGGCRIRFQAGQGAGRT